MHHCVLLTLLEGGCSRTRGPGATKALIKGAKVILGKKGDRRKPADRGTTLRQHCHLPLESVGRMRIVIIPMGDHRRPR